jgi:large subunit ribosomal protein L3
MKGLVAKKISMSQAILEDGKVTAITILQATPNLVTQVKTAEKDGYSALQLTFPKVKGGRGHVRRTAAVREFSFPEGTEIAKGDTVSVDIFAVGDMVDVIGTSKGKGFAGTIKRHNFSRGPMTHGHDHHRAPGSIGAMGMPRVEKGRRMSGRMGGTTITTKNLKVIAVDVASNLVAISGAIPGANNQLVTINKHGE